MTPMQAKLMAFLRARTKAGISPSYAEIGRALGVTHQRAWMLVNKLRKAGYIKPAGFHAPRAIEPAELSEGKSHGQ